METKTVPILTAAVVLWACAACCFSMEDEGNTVNHANNQTLGLKQEHTRINKVDCASSGKSNNVDAMTRSEEYGRTGASDNNEEAKNGMGCDEMDTFEQSMYNFEAYKSAKETMSSQAKSEYEAAKESMSKATGALGDKMRRDAAEV